MGADGDQNHGNRENSWLHIKEEIKEEIQQDQIGPLSVATTTAEDEIKQQVKEEVEEKVELGQDSVEPATTPTTKRRRLTRRNMQGKRAATIATETLARASIKKEKPDDDDVLVKQEESDDQDAHALWLQVKKEIKEEMHQEQIGCLGVGTTIAGHEVKQEVKDEVEDKVDAASHPVGLAITPRAKRRRLTRWNMQEKPADTRTVTQVCIKKEKPDDAQVKQEESDGQDTHALWLQVKQAVKEEMQQDQIGCLGVGTEVKEEVEEKVDTRSDPVGPAITSTPPSKKRHLARKETKIKKEKGDDREAPQDQPDESEIKEELGKKDSTADSIKIKEEHIVDASSILPPSKEAGCQTMEEGATQIQAFRAELVKQGVLKEPKPVDPNFTSEVPGVNWNKRDKKWQVQLGAKAKKRIGGGCFTDKAAAESKALELAKLHGLDRKVTAVGSIADRLAGLPVFEAKVPYPGVTWDQGEQQWHAQCQINGKTRHFRVKPKDHSEAELEASHKKAVAWKKKKEKEKAAK
eukprot:g31959.t1